MRLRPFLGGETREPEGEVDVCVAAAGVIPVEEKSTAVAEAEVVAPHVEVHEVIAVELDASRRVDQDRERRIEPRARREAE